MEQIYAIRNIHVELYVLKNAGYESLFGAILTMAHRPTEKPFIKQYIWARF